MIDVDPFKSFQTDNQFRAKVRTLHVHASFRLGGSTWFYQRINMWKVCAQEMCESPEKPSSCLELSANR